MGACAGSVGGTAGLVGGEDGDGVLKWGPLEGRKIMGGWRREVN